MSESNPFYVPSFIQKFNPPLYDVKQLSTPKTIARLLNALTREKPRRCGIIMADFQANNGAQFYHRHREQNEWMGEGSFLAKINFPMSPLPMNSISMARVTDYDDRSKQNGRGNI